MIIPGEKLKESIVYKLFINYIYQIITSFYKIRIKNKENIHNGDSSCIYISRHSLHNWELLIGLFTINKFSKKPVRGLGHYLIYIMAPYYVLLGVVVGNRKTAERLINGGEYLFIIPGGMEEMTFGKDNFYKTYWYSKSRKYKTGFAKLAVENNIPVVPIHGRNCEFMVFSPIAYLADKLNIQTTYSNIMENVKSDLAFKILFYIKAIFTFIFCGLLVIPVPTNIELIVGEKIEKRENETALQFAKRCEIGLNVLLSN